MSHQISQRKLSHKKIHKKGGFVLLLTMLIVSVILSISLSIFSVTIKEVQLATFLRQSERAFIAANRALECTLFWDRALPAPNPGNLQYTPFPTSTTWTIDSITGNMPNVTCNTGVVGVRLDSLSGWGLSSNETTTTFNKGPFVFTFSDGTSADVFVQKNDIITTITSNGYNTSDVNNLRRTQRTIVARYNI